MLNKPELVKILSVKNEGRKVKIFALKKNLPSAKPGQFAMVWIPGIGEKPYSYSKISGNIEFWVKKVGRFSKRFYSLNKGDSIGIRGPYGNGFTTSGTNVCIVTGGVGIAPILPLIEELKKDKDRKIFLLFGARTKHDIIINEIKKLKNTCDSCIITTEDGSVGIKGFCVDCLSNLIKKENIDQIYSCGPEIMMKKVMDIALESNVSCQLSLERYMKCGIGLCGSCTIDPTGLIGCKDGPVFDVKKLAGTEFGKYKRDRAGSIISF